MTLLTVRIYCIAKFTCIVTIYICLIIFIFKKYLKIVKYINFLKFSMMDYKLPKHVEEHVNYDVCKYGFPLPTSHCLHNGEGIL